MSEELNLSPTRPYMVRSIHQWIEDNNLTPYLMVDTTYKNVRVPVEHIQDGKIVLNIGSRATGNMSLGNDYISFNARFGGVSQELWVPLESVMGIYAKENSQGMFFDPKEYDNYTPSKIDSDADSAKAEIPKVKRENKAGLKILK